MKLFPLQRKWGELEDLRSRWMCFGKQLIVVDSWTLGSVVRSSLGAICKREDIECIFSWIVLLLRKNGLIILGT